jgi:hypothetical protein
VFIDLQAAFIGWQGLDRAELHRHILRKAQRYRWTVPCQVSIRVLHSASCIRRHICPPVSIFVSRNASFCADFHPASTASRLTGPTSLPGRDSARRRRSRTRTSPTGSRTRHRPLVPSPSAKRSVTTLSELQVPAVEALQRTAVPVTFGLP